MLLLLLLLLGLGMSMANVDVAPSDVGVPDSWIVVFKDNSYVRLTGVDVSYMETLDNNDPDIAWIEQEMIFEPYIFQCNVTSWGLDRITLPNDRNYTYIRDGTGVNIYIVDTGIRTSHQEFDEGRATFGYDAFNDDMGDPHGHGTHVAGIAAGKIHGAAKKANLISVRVLDETGSGTTGTVADGLDWILNNKNHPCIVSMSIGSGKSTLVNSRVDLLKAANCTVIVAAGNANNDACNYSPGSATGSFGVGATDIANTRAWFSNYGTCVDIFAPGVNIISAGIADDDDTDIFSTFLIT